MIRAAATAALPDTGGRLGGRRGSCEAVVEVPVVGGGGACFPMVRYGLKRGRLLVVGACWATGLVCDTDTDAGTPAA